VQSRANKEDEQIKLLKELVALQDQTRQRMLPSVEDVPRINLSPKRTWSSTLTYSGTLITGSSTVPNNGALSFQLSSAADSASLLNVFDAYKIIQVICEFIPASIGTTGTTTTNGFIATAIDYGDAVAIDSTAILQYDTCQVVNSPQFFERRFTPRAAKAVYSGAFTSYGQDVSPWIDSNSPNVQHYGLKYSQSIMSSAVTTYTVLTTLHVKFRNSK